MGFERVSGIGRCDSRGERRNIYTSSPFPLPSVSVSNCTAISISSRIFSAACHCLRHHILSHPNSDTSCDNNTHLGLHSTSNMHAVHLLLVAALSTLTLGAPQCPIGEELDPETRQCSGPTEPECAPNRKWDPRLKRCVEELCPLGQTRDQPDGPCVPRVCQADYQIDPATGLCVRIPCPTGTVRNATSGACEQTPCSAGFARNKDGVCVDTRPCPALQYRGSDGLCHFNVFTCPEVICGPPPCPPGFVRLKNGSCIPKCPIRFVC